MNFRRLACLLLGVWLGGSAWMTVDAARAVSGAERLASAPSPTAAAYLSAAGRDVARELLRHGAAERTRWALETWQSVELALGVAVLFVLLFGTREGKYPLFAALLLLVLAGFERFMITPEIVSRGRLLDFMAPGGAAGERAKMFVLEGARTGLEVGKAAVGAMLAGMLLVTRRSGHAGREVDLVDQADYRHVNR